MGRRRIKTCEPGYRPESYGQEMLRVARRKDHCTTTGETTSHLAKLANYANQVIDYAPVDAALCNGLSEIIPLAVFPDY